MKTIKLLILLFFLSTSLVKAEVINQIEINGNKRVADETVIIYGEIKKNVNYREKDLNTIINNLYSTELFENVSVKIENNVLKVNLVEYKSINSLSIVGEKSTRISKEIRRIIKLKEKRSYVKSYLANDIETILLQSL